jgi:hypothetical protein
MVASQKELVSGGGFLISETSPQEVFSPEDFTEEHRMMVDSVRQFREKRLSRNL